MADDKKDLKPEEQTKNGPAAPEQQPPGKDAPPAKEAAGSPPAKDSDPAKEKADTAGPADKGRAGNVIDLSGATIDKILAEKEKAAKVAEAGKGQPSEPAKSGQKKKKEPEKKVGRSTSTAKKPPEKSAKPPAAKKDAPKKDTPAADGPGLEEQKAKLEQELRKKYGIAKTDKPVEPFVIPETELLNGDVIDGIMLEEKKEVDKVIINGMELEKYFGKEKTPQEMKDQIIKLLDDWKGKQKEQAKPEKKAEQEK